MPVSLKVLAKYGVTIKRLKELLSVDPKTLPGDDKRKSLYDLVRTRVNAAREKSIADWRKWHAIDAAYDVPFNQVTPTMLSSMDAKQASGTTATAIKDSFDLLNEKGFNRVSTPDPKSGKNIEKTEVDIPSFFQIFMPMAKSYLTMRHGKLMADFDQTPMMKYEPAMSTAKSRMQCEAVTNRIERQGGDMGYRDTWSQFVFNYLHYGIALAFPREEWYTEEHEQPDGKNRIDKEGLRYHIPHPSRIDYDLAFPLSSLNHDTGCSYVLYWKAVTFGSIRRNTGWWNTDKVAIGSTDWWTTNSQFFNTMYGTAAIRFPINWTPQNTDRETAFADKMTFYGPEQDDKPCLQTEIFQKIIPSEYGLGDYHKPVWFRFVVAGEYSILYGAPLPYCPAWEAKYDPDENRSDTASMTMEMIPYQDMFTQLSSQYMLAVKQNLANITFVDTDVFAATDDKNKDWFNKLTSMGTRLFEKINFLPISGKKFNKALLGPSGGVQAFQSFKFPNMNTTEILGAMRFIIEITERMMGITSQEVGQSASHELRVDEVRAMQSSATIRSQATKMPLTRAMFAWMEQLYNALMEYGTEDMWAQIPFEASIQPPTLQAMGFTVRIDEHPKATSDNTIVVNFKKDAISMLEFASTRPQDERANNPAAAAQMLAALGQAIQVPIVMQTVGRQVIPLLNMIFRLAGFPRDFQLDDHGDMEDELSEQETQQIVAMLKELKDGIMQEVQGGLEPIAGAVKKTMQEQEAMEAQHQKMMGSIDQLTGAFQAMMQQRAA